MTETLVTPTPKPSAKERAFFIGSIATLIVAGMLILFAIFNFASNQKQQEALDKQTTNTNDLINQVADLTRQNKDLSQRAANYAYCNAVLLSQYTQTQQPITIDDLNNCVLKSFPNGTGAPQQSSMSTNSTSSSNSSTSRQTASGGSTGASTLQPASGGGSATSTNNPAPSNNSSPIITTTPTTLLPGINLGVPCLNTGVLGVKTCQ